MTQNKSSTRPVLELAFASVFWGFGFIGTIWALRALSPPAIIAYRFVIAFAVGSVMLLALRTPLSLILHEAKLAFGAGFLLCLTLVLQTSGLLFTTATKSAFITTTYVIIVPLLSHFFLKARIEKLHWLWVFLALVGTLLIINLKDTNLVWGDTFTLLNAWAAALHILYVDRISSRSKNPFIFNVTQSFWAGLFALAFFPFTEKWQFFSLDFNGWIGLLSLAFGSTLLGFYLQIRAQKQISASLASLLFLLESPMSFFFAYFLLHERLNFLQFFGALLIIFACVGASLKQGAHKVLVEP